MRIRTNIQNQNDNLSDNYYTNYPLYQTNYCALFNKNTENKQALSLLSHTQAFDSAIILQSFFRKKIFENRNNYIYNWTEKDLGKKITAINSIRSLKDRKTAVHELLTITENDQHNNAEIINAENAYPNAIKTKDGTRFYPMVVNTDTKGMRQLKYLRSQQAKGIYPKHKGQLIKRDLEYKYALSLLSSMQRCDATITLQSFARRHIAQNTLITRRDEYKKAQQLKIEQAAKIKIQQDIKATRLAKEQLAIEKLRLEEDRKEAQRQANKAAKKEKELQDAAKKEAARKLQSDRDKAKKQTQQSPKKSGAKSVDHISDDQLTLLLKSEVLTTSKGESVATELLTPNTNNINKIDTIIDEQLAALIDNAESQTIESLEIKFYSPDNNEHKNLSADICECNKTEQYNSWIHEKNQRKQLMENEKIKRKQAIEIDVRKKHLSSFLKNNRGKRYIPNEHVHTIEAHVLKEYEKKYPGYYDEEEENDAEVIETLLIYAQNIQQTQSVESFCNLEQLIAKIEIALQAKGECLAWHLATNPRLYT